YRQVLAAPDADPTDHVEDTTALYYALNESDHADEARAVAETLAASQKPRVELKGLPFGNPNDSWMDAQQLDAQAETSGSDLPTGEQRLQT
ncbi:poly-beta-1,6 N-acetyl-D-glucosamine export porin PgaA, partial [Pseudomonas sp. RTC3]|nr:poly-beta-1,6 N-acetyl-D-glucosamine export porin PgaA [Pseudomonas sp. RTC3]